MITRILTGEPPLLKTPAGTTDTHIHFYDSRYTAVPGTPLPPDATVSEYREVMQWLGIERAVIVQPNAYGDDNSVTMDSVAALGKSIARAVVVVKPGLDEAQLQALTDGGARGARVMALLGGMVRLDQLTDVAAMIHPFGWHPIVQLDGRDLPEHEATLKALPGNFVIDHVGKFTQPTTVDDAGFKTLLRLLDTGRCYIKIAAMYETSQVGAPTFGDVGALAKALIHHAPERALWASNWPHAQAAKFGYPNDANLLDLLLEWAPNETAIRRMLVDNPARLYGF
jgi:D-galactarolactone isomerase